VAKAKLPLPLLMNHFIALRWLKVSLVVGTALNLINQYDAVLGPELLDWPRLMLTYCVPYAVASVSSWNAKQDQEPCRVCNMAGKVEIAKD
jgi:methyl-accepting chemotaxis protein